MCVCKQPWPLIVACAILYPALLFSSTHSTPIAARRGREPTPCTHDSIGALIKKSPVILKALGAHVFTDDARTDELLDGAVRAGAVNAKLKLQSVQSNFLALATQLKQNQQPLMASEWPRSEYVTATNSAGAVDDESILITLTPETIYKGASLLKMTPGAENAARGGGIYSSGRGDGGGVGRNSSYGSGGGGSATAEAAYQYEGQLNATLQPLSCFETNLLKILPTEIIVFGKLITGQTQQPGEVHAMPQMDFLAVNINGLHRWSPQFENHIWKHLGWDDWSDFTLCSVTCGKGVQQRFRRCLLDNPMVSFNMQVNLNTVADEEEDEDDEDVIDDNTLSSSSFDVNRLLDSKLAGFNNPGLFATRLSGGDSREKQQQQQQNTINKENSNVSTKDETETRTVETDSDADTAVAAVVEAVASTEYSDYRINKTHKSHLRQIPSTAAIGSIIADGRVEDSKGANSNDIQELMRTFEGNRKVNEDTFFGGSRFQFGIESTKGKSDQKELSNKTRRQQKRRKPTKNYSTMFCEGYNIEQRNCNIFECSDDLSDLLKFYKKMYMPEEVASPATVAMQSSPVMPSAADSHTTTAITMISSMLGAAVTASSAGAAMTVDLAGNATTITTGATTATGDNAGAASGVGNSLSVGTAYANANPAANRATAANSPPSTTPANMGYIRSWRNPLNFTIMLTLRVRNDSKTATTIFSIRNATHNLYLESCKDGLRLYLERDSTTEMLPLKFNLYDYRWHQVAISIQNGDFISIYVDCSWTNSFVVSKRLYTLPLNADVEIGRGFKGELQQLLVLPDNQERQQCSNKRTSINEVKRYIIDTFIDDYGN